MPRFDETRQAVTVALLGQGFRRSEVAARVGVTAETIRRLIRAGLDADGKPLPDTFAERVAEAEGSAPITAEAPLLEAAREGNAWAIQALKRKYRGTR